MLPDNAEHSCTKPTPSYRDVSRSTWLTRAEGIVYMTNLCLTQNDIRLPSMLMLVMSLMI